MKRQNSSTPQSARAGSRRGRRAGSILVLAMGCLFAVLLLSAAVLKTLSIHSAYVRHERFRAQADWLVASGTLRLDAKLRGDNEYQGEVWNIPASELGGNDDAQVEIVRLQDRAPRTFHIKATYPLEKSQHVTKTREFTRP